MNGKKLKQDKIDNYRFQLWPSTELIRLVREAVLVSSDARVSEMQKGWFSILIRAALTCYIAYCKTMARNKGKQS